MKIIDILSMSYTTLAKLFKNRLLMAFQYLREKYIKLEEKNNELKSVSRNANKPSSKQPKWDEKGVGNDGKGKKKGKGRGKKPRKGAGNRPKNHLLPDRTEKATVDFCNLCGKDLTDDLPLESSNERIIEDIPDIIEKPEVIQIKQEKKYCTDCKEVITVKYELALPKADMGLNSTILICYLWVALCLPFTKIKDYLKTFFGKEISTSGLSQHVIWVSSIMKDVYDEILGNINNGATLHADETGWRVRGEKIGGCGYLALKIRPILQWTNIEVHLWFAGCSERYFLVSLW